MQGGGGRTIWKAGNTVRRAAGFWTPRVHEYLTFLSDNGFPHTPRPLEIQTQDEEILTFIPGEVGNYPLSEAIRSENALVSAARLLKRLHDCSVEFAFRNLDGWMFPPREPLEVVCHGDFAPYNCVFVRDQAVGVIDFDGAHPGPRLWDLAYAVYRFAPVTSPDNHDGFGSSREQLRRARLFCDTYGLALADRPNLPDMMIRRLETLVNFMYSEAERGNKTMQKNIDDGHAVLYRRDSEYIAQQSGQMITSLTNFS
jgi:Ser/Thr protein kinase RdoA (MazF antagonist)